MQKQFIFCLMIFVHFIPDAHAQGGMGSGGGNAFVCFTDSKIADQYRHGILDSNALNNIESIEAIDLIYAREPSAFTEKENQILDPKNLNYIEIFAGLTKRISLTIPWLADHIHSVNQQFKNNTLIRNFPIPRIDDINDEVNYSSSKCLVLTVAVQKAATIKEGISLQIDGRLFNHPKHSEMSKAILLLHEHFYAMARMLGEQNSRTTRLLVRKVISKNVLSYDLLKLAIDYSFLQNLSDNAVYLRPIHLLRRAIAEYDGLFVRHRWEATPVTEASLRKTAADHALEINEHYFNDVSIPLKLKPFFIQVTNDAVESLIHSPEHPDDLIPILQAAYLKNHGQQLLDLTKLMLPDELSL